MSQHDDRVSEAAKYSRIASTSGLAALARTLPVYLDMVTGHLRCAICPPGPVTHNGFNEPRPSVFSMLDQSGMPYIFKVDVLFTSLRQHMVQHHQITLDGKEML
jgi:hypothetical protein